MDVIIHRLSRFISKKHAIDHRVGEIRLVSNISIILMATNCFTNQCEYRIMTALDKFVVKINNLDGDRQDVRPKY